MKKNSHKFYLSFLLLLFSFLLFPLNTVAQSQNAAEVIQRYENGQITKPTQEEKAILRSYLNERTQQSSTIGSSQYSDLMLATFINENFATATVTTPPAGWTQNRIAGDPTFDFWHFDNPGTRTLNAPITSPAAIFDSDNYSLGGGPENVALESPTFNVPAAATVFLEWNQYFFGGFGGEINVEVFNGTSWINVYTTIVSTPNPDLQSINISTHVAGIANARVRFRWVGDYSWYWIVDNVKVYSTATGLTGIKNIPGDYATLELAINDLNAQGVGNGGVTLNLLAANPQTAPAGGYIIGGTGSLVLTSTGPLDQVVIQGNGNTITAFTPQTSGQLYDGIFKIIGADWITINNFTMLENPANTITAAATNDMTEWGVAVLYESATNGAQNNTVSNCIIDLNRTYQNTFGVYSNSTHTPTAVTVTASATGPAGGNHGLKIISNQITDVNQGIVVVGPTAAADYNNVLLIGGTVPNGNFISNYGTTGTFSSYANVSATINGILVRNTINMDVSYNSVTSSVGGVTSGTLNGIQLPAFSVAPIGTFTNSINYNSISLSSGVAGGAINGIACLTTTASATSTININNNNFNTFGHTVAGTAAIIFISQAGTHLNQSISNNTFTDISVNTTGSVTFVSNTNTPPVGSLKNVNNNSIVTAFNKTGAGGTVTLFVDNGSDPNTTCINNSNNNNFSNITVTGATIIAGWGNTNGGAPTKNVNGNTFSNWIGGTSAVTGLNINFDAGLTTAQNNLVSNILSAGTITGINFGSSSTAGTTYASLNTVHTLTSTGASVVTGFAIGGAATVARNIFGNRIYNLESNNAAGSVVGMLISSGTIYVYNNFISDLRAPVCSLATDGVRGISITSTTATSSVRLFYNSIYLNAGSSGANFSSSGIFHTNSTTATTAALDMRNNVVVNVSVPQGTGLTVTFRRSAVNAALNNYSTLSNNNDFFAGTPGPANLIFFDGTNADQTIAAFKARVTPRETASFTENPPFLNVSTPPYNLHMNTAIATQTESGGTPVTSPIAITTDFDGDTRNATSPDVGADEFAGIVLDLTPPVIVYTPLLNTSSVANRTLVVTVTDLSGVPIVAPGWPNLYWKKNVGGVWTASTPTGVAGSIYTYSFGSGVVIGDTVFYYVVAQDGAVPPNVGAYPSLGAGGFTANPPAAAIPPTTPSRYVISQAALAGNYTVGLLMFNQITGNNIYFDKVVQKVMKEVDVEVPNVKKQVEKGKELQNAETTTSYKPKTIKQLMEVEEISWIPMQNGQPYYGDLYVKKIENPEFNYPVGTDGIYSTITAAVADLNLRGVGGATTFLLNDASYPTETYPLVINVANEGNFPTATNTVTIKPNTGVTSLVQGASAASQMFKILNSYVTIDGSNAGGTDRSLTVENTSVTTPQVIVIGSTGTTPITNVTLKNCIFINGVNTSSAVIVSDGTTPATAGWFNNITIQNNSIQKAYIANYNIAVMSAGNGNGLLLTSNDLSTSGANAVRLVGLYVQGVDGATVSNNSVGNIVNTIDAANITGVWFATGTINSTLSNNTFGPISGTAGGPRGIVITSAVANANVNVTGNTVTGMTTASTGIAYGIFAFSTTSGVTIEKNRISNIKNTNAGGYSAIGIALGSTLTAANMTASNNFIWDVAGYGYTSTTTDNGFGINLLSGGGYNLYHNSVGLSTEQTSATGNPACLIINSAVTTSASLDIRDNIFATFQTVGAQRYAVLCNAANTVFSNINYNDYYSAGPNLGYIGAINRLDLAAWQAGTGQDLQSISGDPKFAGVTDLHIDPAFNVVSNNGFYLASVPTDIDGDARSVTNPDIGADEYIYTPPAVIDPTNVTASAISSTQIDVAFTPNASNNNVVIVFNLDGVFTTPSGIPPAVGQPFAGGTLIANTITSPYNHIGLTPATAYYYKLFSYQSIGDQYSPGVAVDAATLCGLITTFPFAESFDVTTFPPTCWANTQVSGSGLWARVTAGVYPTCTPHSGVGMAEYASFNFSAGAAAILVTPQIAFPADDYRIKFWMYRDTGYPSNADRVQVYYNTSPDTTGGTFLGVINRSTTLPPTVTVTDWYEYSFNMPSGSGGNAYIIFLGISAYGNNMFVDDVTVEQLPITPVFSIDPTSKDFGEIVSGSSSLNQTFTITNIGAGTLTINSGGISIVGTDASQFTLTDANTYPINLTNSQSATVDVKFSPTTIGSKYAILRIVDNITDAIHDIPLTGVGITPPSLPYVQDFEGTFPPSGWLNYGNKLWTQSSTGGVGGSKAARVVYTPAGTANLQSPPFNIPATPDYRIRFWWKDNDIIAKQSTEIEKYEQNKQNSDSPEIAGYDTTFFEISSDGGTSWAVLSFLSAASPMTNYVEQIVDLTSYASQTVTFRWRDWSDGSISAWGVGLDDITIDQLPFLAPTNLVATADTFTVTLSWQDNSNNELGFVIERKDGDSLSVNPFLPIDTVGVDVSFYFDTGLSPNTTYTYRVYGYNSQGNSGYSNMAEATTFIPVEFTSFTADISGRDVMVNWTTATETNNHGFDIERKLDGEWEKIGFKDGKGTTTEESFYSFVDKFTYESYLGTITYRLKQMDFDGTYAYSAEVEVNVDFTPKDYTLYQNYPNPFNPVTTIKYSLPFESNVRIVVYNILGEMLDVLVDETKQVGFHDFNWNASNLASGIYIYTIEAKSVNGDKNYSSVKKMILMK